MNQGAAIGIAMLIFALVYMVSPRGRWRMERLAWAGGLGFIAYMAIVSGKAGELVVALVDSLTQQVEGG